MKPKHPNSLGGLPITEDARAPAHDAVGLTEEQINGVVVEFYRRTLLDPVLEPVFSRHIHDWDAHLGRMTDFWSAALLHSGRYSGRPAERHRLIDGLSVEHFDRWLLLFEATVRELCSPSHADAFMIRAQRMRAGLSRALDLD